eukprot:s4634_g5.t1
MEETTKSTAIDDLLIQAENQVLHTFYKWVADKWEVDALDLLDYNHPIRFLGMEIHQTPEGIELGQEGFVRELLRSHKHNGAKSMSQGPKELLILSDEEEQALVNAETIDLTGLEAEVKEAQRRVGELMWLMSRTRPDLQYIVALMSSKLIKNPQMVNKLGQRLLDYLNETIGYRIKLNGYEESDGEMLNVYTDSSFAPSGGRSHGCAAVFLGSSPLTWRSSRESVGGGDVADDIQRKLEDKTSKVEILLDEGADPPTGITSATCTWARTEGGPGNQAVHKGTAKRTGGAVEHEGSFFDFAYGISESG